jgi:hypothetical protein
MLTLSTDFLSELGRRNIAAMTAPENWPQACERRRRLADEIKATYGRYLKTQGWTDR